MLLFSTILPITNKLTKEGFINTVFEWNENSPHKENIIPNLEWNGESYQNFSYENLSLEIQEYRDKNIVAVRYIKQSQDSVIWKTDYVVNFDEKKIAVQLDRSYEENALITNAGFSTPKFIDYLEDKGYLALDDKLPIGRKPIYIDGRNIQLLADLINGDTRYSLPVVYVSKTFSNLDPIDVKTLAYKLKGAAHVMVISDTMLSTQLKELCDGKNEYNGCIGIYYPNKLATKSRILHNGRNEEDKEQFDSVLNRIINNSRAQAIESLYTWYGVQYNLLTARVESKNQENYEKETQINEILKENKEDMIIFEELCNSYKRDVDRKDQAIADLTQVNISLEAENAGLRNKLNQIGDDEAILYKGNEEEMYEGEVKDVILYAVEKELKRIEGINHGRTRTADILRSIIEANDYQEITKMKHEVVKRVLKKDLDFKSGTRAELEEIGVVVKSEDNHYKLTYYGNDRYMVTLAKSTTDKGRTPKNAAQEIINLML